MTKKKTITKPRVDVHQVVTNQIIEAIEAGADSWKMPWHVAGKDLGCPENIDTKNRYNGINILALWVSGMVHNYESGIWGTYRQWLARGCQVRKGEKSTTVVFYKELKGKGADDEGRADESEEGRSRLMARASSVFNAAQVDGYEPPAPPARESSEFERIKAVETFVERTGADIRHGGEMAFYRRGEDYIQIPNTGRFMGTKTSSAVDSYYQTKLHELTHWTSAESRCDRTLGKRFGTEAYAMEELVAELCRTSNYPEEMRSAMSRLGLVGRSPTLLAAKRAVLLSEQVHGDVRNNG